MIEPRNIAAPERRSISINENFYATNGMLALLIILLRGLSATRLSTKVFQGRSDFSKTPFAESAFVDFFKKKANVKKLLLCAGFVAFFPPAHGEKNVIFQIGVAQSGIQHIFWLKLRAPLNEAPSVITVAGAPRLVFDFKDMTSEVPRTSIFPEIENLKSVDIIQGEGRTRLVLSMREEVAYTIESRFDTLYIAMSAPQEKIVRRLDKSQTAPRNEQDLISLDLRGTQIYTASRVLSAIMGISVVLDPVVKGKLSLTSGTPLERSAVVNLFKTKLSLLGYNLTAKDNSFYISPSLPKSGSDASNFQFASTRSWEKYRLSNISATWIFPALEAMLTAHGELSVDEAMNTISVKESPEIQTRIKSMINAADIK